MGFNSRRRRRRRRRCRHGWEPRQQQHLASEVKIQLVWEAVLWSSSQQKNRDSDVSSILYSFVKAGFS